MSEIQEFQPVFPANGYSLRALLIEGEPWFVAADVCGALGLTNPKMVVSRLDRADVSQADISSSGQARKMSIINESGLYELIMRSDKPEARIFRRWITSEVLPSIRKTGAYAAPVDPAQQALAMARALVAASEENQELRELNRISNEVTMAQREVIDSQKPAMEAYATYMDADGLCDMATAAAALHVGRNSLFQELRRKGVLISTPGAQYNTPKARYKVVPHGLGWFEIKTGTRERSSGELEPTYTTMVTPKGLEGVRRLLDL